MGGFHTSETLYVVVSIATQPYRHVSSLLPYMKVPPHIDSLKNSAPFKVKGFSLAFNLKPLYVTLVQSSHSNGQGQVQQAQANTDVCTMMHDLSYIFPVKQTVLVWSLEYVTRSLSAKKIPVARNCQKKYLHSDSSEVYLLPKLFLNICLCKIPRPGKSIRNKPFFLLKEILGLTILS